MFQLRRFWAENRTGRTIEADDLEMRFEAVLNGDRLRSTDIGGEQESNQAGDTQ